MSVTDPLTSKHSSASGAVQVSEAVKPRSLELDAILEAIALDARERRERGKRELPFNAIEQIKKSRLGAFRLPADQGGSGATLKELFSFLIRLAEADPDAAHALRYHYYQVEQFLAEPDSAERESWLKRVANGDLIGNSFAERTSKDVGIYNFETALTPDGEGYRLNGKKYFCTGTLFADWVAVLATNVEGQTVSIFIPANRGGVIIRDDWDGIGQQLTGSGTTEFDHVYVNADEVKLVNEQHTRLKSFLQIYLQALIAGILRNIALDAGDLLKSRKRTFTFAAASRPEEDPQLLQIAGELASTAFAAEAIVLAVADTLDEATTQAHEGSVPSEWVHKAALESAQAKVVIDQLALKAATDLFDVGGASATRQSAGFDRHWRNIRTLASHNPVPYKARTVGDYVVNGNELPISGAYF